MTSAHVRAAVAALVATVALLGSPLTVATAQAATTTTSARAATTTTRAATTDPVRFGVSYGERLSRMSQSELDAVLDDAVLLGVRWIRIDFSWTTIQAKGPTSWAWAGTDRVVEAARARGLKVLPILTYTPAWARDAGCTRFSCPPHSARQFARFAKAAVARYKSRGVRTWEVWNEPNLHQFWPRPNAKRYAALLIRTFKAIRAQDSRAVVLHGGLAALENRPPSVGPRQFLRGVCRWGACGSMNAVSYHPYTFPFPAGYAASWSAWSKISQTDWSLHSILKNHGYPRKKIWATEYGAPTEGLGTAADGTWASVLPTTTHVTEAWQAAIAADVVDQARKNPHVAALFWYTNQDLPVLDRREASFGLRRLDGVPKPAWAAFGSAVRSGPVG